MKTGPSEHLSWDELACGDGTPYPAKWRLTKAIRLAHAFETVRALWGQPVVINSAYRTPQHNAAIGGAQHSWHVEGLALDLKPPEGVPVQDFWTDIVRVADKAGIGGVGYAAPSRGNYVHIDCRPRPVDGHLATWRY